MVLLPTTEALDGVGCSRLRTFLNLLGSGVASEFPLGLCDAISPCYPLRLSFCTIQGFNLALHGTGIFFSSSSLMYSLK